MALNDVDYTDICQWREYDAVATPSLTPNHDYNGKTDAQTEVDDEAFSSLCVTTIISTDTEKIM